MIEQHGHVSGILFHSPGLPSRALRHRHKQPAITVVAFRKRRDHLTAKASQQWGLFTLCAPLHSCSPLTHTPLQLGHHWITTPSPPPPVHHLLWCSLFLALPFATHQLHTRTPGDSSCPCRMLPAAREPRRPAYYMHSMRPATCGEHKLVRLCVSQPASHAAYNYTPGKRGGVLCR